MLALDFPSCVFLILSDRRDVPGWGDRPYKHMGLHSTPRTNVKIPVAQTCNPNAGEEGTGGSLGLTSQQA